jgi:hypothetical protein
MTQITHTHPHDPIMIRPAVAADEPALELLAELDSARPPSGPALIAERQGQAVAALTLADGVVIANPFLPTGDLVALLRLRASQVAVAPSLNRGQWLAGRAAAYGKPIHHASDRLHRLLKRPHVTIQGLNRRQQPVQHRR